MKKVLYGVVLNLLSFVLVKQILSSVVFYEVFYECKVIHIKTWIQDTPLSFIKFQDPATSTMEFLISFNLKLIILIFFLILLVGWAVLVVIQNFFEFMCAFTLHYHEDSEVEKVWTSVPAFLLLTLTFPSFTLLYLIEKIEIPTLTLKVGGNQWYWQYEIDDFNWCGFNESQQLEYSCYILTTESLKEDHHLGFFRNLETNRRVMLPANASIRLLISSIDVLHSWTIPSFGIKLDACPGRVNQIELNIKRPGVFFGQCSEICGINHGFMPIALISVPSQLFYASNTHLLNF